MKKTIFLLLLVVSTNMYPQLSKFQISCFAYDQSVRTSDLRFRTVGWQLNETDFSNYINYLTDQGFNTIEWELPNGGIITNFLAICESKGINSIIGLTCDLSGYYQSTDFSLSQIDNIVKFDQNYQYNKFLGYCIKDEPHIANVTSVSTSTEILYRAFRNIVKTSEYIKQKDASSRLLNYVNFDPSFAYSDQEYRHKYLQHIIDSIKPNLLSVDHYPIYSLDDTGNPAAKYNFFRTLYDTSLKSVENSIPFVYILTPYQSSTHFKDALIHSSKTISQFSYVIYAALMYGAKGINYWPGFDWVVYDGGDGNSYPKKLNYDDATKLYLKNLHAKLNSHSAELLSLNFASAYHKDFTSTIGSTTPEQIHDFCEWVNFKNDRYANAIFWNTTTPVCDYYTSCLPTELAISFMVDTNGRIYYWLFNKSLSNTMNLVLSTKSQPKDVLNGGALNYYGGGAFVGCILGPGEAKLFTPNDNTTTMPDLTLSNPSPYGSNFYAFELANNIQISNTTFDGATKSFMARQIVLNPGVSIYSGSTVRLRAYTDSNNGSGPSLAPKHKQSDNTVIKSVVEPKAYPNPTKDNFIVNTNLSENEKIDMTVYDNMGRVIKMIRAVSQETSISLQNQPSGVYFVRFSQNDKTYNYKIVKL